MNVKLESSNSINKKIKDVVVINVITEKYNNLKNNLTKILKINDLDFVKDIEKKINKNDTDLSMYIKINNDNYHLFILNVFLEEDEYILLKKNNNINNINHIKSNLPNKHLDKKELNNKDYDLNLKIGNIIEIFRKKGSDCFFELENNDISDVNICMVSDFKNDVNGSLNIGFIEGLMMTSYSFDKYKTDENIKNKNKKKTKKKSKNSKKKSKKKETKKEENEKFNYNKNFNDNEYELNCHMVFPEVSNDRLKLIKNHTHKLLNRLESWFLSTNLVNETGYNLPSKKFVKIINNFITNNKLPLNVEIFDRDQLKEMGMNLLVSVGEGSKADYKSRLMIIHYNPKNKGKKCKNPDYVLIGKGITFDTGGYSLKYGDDTYEMKCDMAGAAVVSSFILGHSKNKGESSVVCMVPLAENAINGINATKPGDIIKSYSGKTVEIIDTDAEGRLVMADCLSYANKNFKNAVIMDFSTLTGSQDSFSCKIFGSVVSRHKTLLDKMYSTGNYIQEKMIGTPYLQEFEKFIESDTADMRNVGNSDCGSGILTAATFLAQFVNEDKKWVHIDFAGPSWKNDKRYYPTEGSSFGLRFLYELIN